MGHGRSEAPRCTVSGAEKLLDGIGGADAICSAIHEADRRRAAGVDYAVEVRVEAASMLSARITLNDGRTLPEQKLVVSDRSLNAGSIERFAASIAEAAAGAAN